MKRLIAIVGPTASGKSDLAMRLAQQFDCEIVSGDSMCVYRGMNIGTAKPLSEELQMIRHHLIDIREPGEEFSVVDFQRLAGECVADINQRGKIPILVGGTGLYVQALLEGYRFNTTPKTVLRDQMSENRNDNTDSSILYNKLLTMDPETALHIHSNDKKRILRALEVIMTERRSISREKVSNTPTLLFDCLVIGLSVERDELYRRINERVDRMVEAGLVEEVHALMSKGLPSESTAFQAIGYKEIAAYLNGAGTLEEAIDRVKQSSRRYAKRQLTWFRRMPYIQWIDQGAVLQGHDSFFNVVERRVAEKFVIK